MPNLFPAAWRTKFRRQLLAWFRSNARDLPWRRTRDPYAIWVSEIMLQQTQVVTVIPYFERFVAAFPNVVSLAAAPERDVLRLWEGLGYYRRARQLHAASQKIVAEHAGEFPREFAAVRALPGIGRYTAGAILSIAHDDRQPILEANTVRLLSRLLAFRGDPTKTAGQKLLWQAAEELLPTRRAGELNQALMELGSQICTPRDPRCGDCPVARLCPTRAAGLQAEIPTAKQPPRYEDVIEAAVVVRRGAHILLRRCGPDERWAGLWDFPRFPLSASHAARVPQELESKTKDLTQISIAAGRRFATLKHGVTRFRITLHCHEATFRAGRLRSPHRWVRPADLADFPLSTTARKISRLI